MVLIGINVCFFLLAAVPVYIYFVRSDDKVLSGVLITLSTLFIPSLYFAFMFSAAMLWGSYLSWFLICIVPYVLHWVAWLRVTIRQEQASTQVMPLLTVWLLLLAHTVLFVSLVNLLITVLYGCAAVWLYKTERKKLADEKPLKERTNLFKDFSPLRLFYINDEKRETN